MDTSKKIEMTVKFEVTIPQALALQAMFEHWNQLSSMGSSREVGFYVDGDGNFHPKCKFEYSETIPELTDNLRQLATDVDKDGHRRYDFDVVASKLRDS